MYHSCFLRNTQWVVFRKEYFSFLHMLQENIFPSKYISLGHKFFLMSVCLPLTQPVCNVQNPPSPRFNLASQNGTWILDQLNEQSLLLCCCDTARESTTKRRKPWLYPHHKGMRWSFESVIGLCFYFIDCNVKDFLIITHKSLNPRCSVLHLQNTTYFDP